MSVLIKGGRIVTAADDYVGDVFVDGERISLLGESLDVTADTVVDATGKLVLPGLVDPHTHLDMPFGGTTTIDDVTSGHTAAAFGGTTCHVDFCIQGKGQTFAEALGDWHAKREGKAIIDMGFHIAVTDLSAAGPAGRARDASRAGHHVLQALHGLQGRADGRRRDALPHDGGRGEDRSTRDGARGERRRDRRAREGGARRRQHGASLPRADPSARDRGRGDEPRDPARTRRGLPALRRPRLVQGVGRADHARAGEGLGRLGRDVHAVLLRRLHVPRAARTSRARSTSTRRRRGRRRTRTCSGTRCGRTSSPRSRPTIAPFSGTARRRSGRTTSRRSRTAGRASRTDCT